LAFALFGLVLVFRVKVRISVNVVIITFIKIPILQVLKFNTNLCL